MKRAENICIKNSQIFKPPVQKAPSTVSKNIQQTHYHKNEKKSNKRKNLRSIQRHINYKDTKNYGN